MIKLPVEPNLNEFYARVSGMPKRTKMMIYFSFFFFATAFIDRLIIYPVASRIGTLNKEINEKEEAIKRDQQIILMKDKISGESSKYSSMFNPVKSVEAENTILLQEIENLANKTSVYLVDIKPAGVKQLEGGAQKFLITLNCEALTEQLMEFMYSIESSPRLLIIEKFQISRKSSESSVARCAMSISRMAMIPPTADK